MATSPQELAPQYDHRVSQAVYKIETKLAEAEHIVAKQARDIRRFKAIFRHWKQLHTAAQERIVELQCDQENKEMR